MLKTIRGKMWNKNANSDASFQAVFAWNRAVHYETVELVKTRLTVGYLQQQLPRLASSKLF